eukprot:m.278900 g.278900  ORF g.278900 m.278900 type:complete len:92 (+) comp19793_c1_seq4:47-322(+)
MSESKKGKTVKKKNETKKKPGKVQDDIYIVEKLVDKREHKHGKLGTIIQYKVSDEEVDRRWKSLKKEPAIYYLLRGNLSAGVHFGTHVVFL